MKKLLLKRRVLVSLLLMMGVATAMAQQISIIPKPVSVVRQSGEFVLSPQSAIGCPSALEPVGAYLREVLSRSTGYDLPLTSVNKKTSVNLLIAPEKVKGEEGYRLEVSKKNITIYGSTAAGVFYGVQSLLQLFPAEVYASSPVKGVAWKAPAVTIDDAPDRPWRGMMLDVARYFYDKEFVMKFIDMMAMYKMNTLQFHLIDDSGWRLEIKKYPRLTEVGAWSGPKSNRLGGYYSQDDIREIVAYAASRHVDVIPEIEFPAHILSAVVAYPWLSCTGEQHELPTQHFISRDLLCPGKATSIQFLKDVLEETVSLFPSKYINIGGDEAVYTRWKSCPDCQALMKKEGLTDESQLQGYLANVVTDMMKAKGRTAVGWEEIIMRGKVNNPVVALIWHNAEDSIVATRTGHKAVLAAAKELYLDFPEYAIPGEVQAATWLPPVPIDSCYNVPLNDYSPSSTVIGVQGSFWTDQFIHGNRLQELSPLDENRAERYAEYLVFPRLLAIAEVGWDKPSTRHFGDFSDRLTQHYARLDYKGCFYRLPQPRIVDTTVDAQGRYTFTLVPSVPGTRILYTTNGEYPNRHSKEYTGPVTVERKSDFHAITYQRPGRYSLPVYFAPDYSAYKQYGTFVSEWSPLQVPLKQGAMRVELTGKLRGNGTYTVTYVATKGSNGLQAGNLKLMKRDEMMAEVQGNQALEPATGKVSYTFTLDAFEAGTPFYLDLTAVGMGGNDCSGLVFIKKH